jgi:hypothetical protein
MICPKCKSKMTLDYNGYFCYPAGCGYFVRVDAELVMPVVPPLVPQLVRPKGPRPQLRVSNSQKYTIEQGQLNKDAVESHIELIIQRRKEGQNWETVTDEFCMTAHIDMTDTTLRRYCRPHIPPDLMSRKMGKSKVKRAVNNKFTTC